MFTFTSIPNYEKSLDVLSQRQKVISHNLANINTENYKSKDFDFKSALAQSLNASHELDVADTTAYYLEKNAYDRLENRVIESSKFRDESFRDTMEEIKILKREIYDDLDDPDMYETFDTHPDSDGNDVELDEEMAKMSETGILYRAFIELTRKKFSQISAAIKETV